MTTFTNSTTLLHSKIPNHHRHVTLPTTRSEQKQQHNPIQRRKLVSTILVTSLVLAPSAALAQSWGTRSFIREKFFEPGLSPEDAVARIRQTSEGLHELRHMVDTMCWRYIIFYIRVKSSYLNQDLKNAMTTLPEYQRKSYVKAANELVDNMAEFDYYVRTPKVYESYVYYEKTLKSIDNLVALLA